MSNGDNPVTHTELVATKKESTQEMPLKVACGNLNSMVPIKMKNKKLPPRIREGLVRRPNNRTMLLDK